MCYFSGGVTGNSASVPLLFAGLAPGTVGTYQVDVQVPAKPAVVDWQLYCENYLPQTRVSDAITIPTKHQ